MNTWRNPLNWLRNETPAAMPEQRALEPASNKIFVENDGPLFPDKHEPKRDVFDEANIHVGALLDGFFGPSDYISLFHQLPEIFAPIHEIASRVADANWQLLKTWNDEVDYSNPKWNELSEKPNPIMEFKALIYQAVVYEILTGKQIWFANVPRPFEASLENTLAIWNLPANKTTFVTKKIDPYTATKLSDFIQEVRVPHHSGQGFRTFTPDQVMPILNLSMEGKAYDLNKTTALIKGADKAIHNLMPVYEARGLIYIKRGALGMWVNKGKDANGPFLLTDDHKKEILNDHFKNYGITKSKSPVGITSADVEFIRTAMSIAELQPFDETLADAVAIYKVLRVPRHLVPSKDNSTFANADSDMKSFYTDVIIPWAKRYAQTLTAGLNLAAIRRYIKPDYSHIDVLQENKKEKADVDKINGETWMARWKNGAATLNDWINSFEGMPSVGPIYEKKIFELTPEEKEQVMSLIGKKPQENENKPAPNGGGAQGEKPAN